MAPWLLFLAPAALAGGVRVTVEVGPKGASIVDAQHSTAAPRARADGGADGPQAPDHLVEITDATGAVLSRFTVPDPRMRTLLLRDGTGVVAQLERARIQQTVPWPSGAVALRTSLGTRSVRQPLPPAPDAPWAVVPVQESGAASERLDLVILGDGYTAEQLDDFAADVAWVAEYLLDIPPYGAYSEMFNIWRIDVPSDESGIDHPADDNLVQTALDCTYDCFNVPRLVCCDEDTVLTTVEQAVPGADGILVLVNDNDYGGSGGTNYAVSYVGDDEGRQVAAHELGHSLIGLWDEYEYGVPGPGVGPGPNCAEDAGGHWDDWIGSRGVDAFEGCSYDHLVRATDEGCMMRTLSEGYCPICREHTILEMYRSLPGLVRSVEPEPGTDLTVRRDDPPSPIQVDTRAPMSRLAFEWSIDGDVVLEDEPSLDLHCSGLKGELTLRVHDPTDWVRSDPDGLLEEAVGPWTVNAQDCQEPELLSCGCQTRSAPGWPALPVVQLLRRRR